MVEGGAACWAYAAVDAAAVAGGAWRGPRVSPARSACLEGGMEWGWGAPGRACRPWEERQLGHLSPEQPGK